MPMMTIGSPFPTGLLAVPKSAAARSRWPSLRGSPLLQENLQVISHAVRSPARYVGGLSVACSYACFFPGISTGPNLTAQQANYAECSAKWDPQVQVAGTGIEWVIEATEERDKSPAHFLWTRPQCATTGPWNRGDGAHCPRVIVSRASHIKKVADYMCHRANEFPQAISVWGCLQNSAQILVHRLESGIAPRMGPIPNRPLGYQMRLAWVSTGRDRRSSEHFAWTLGLFLGSRSGSGLSKPTPRSTLFIVTEEATIVGPLSCALWQ